MSDPFGLEREDLIRRSRVRDIFTPHKPIHSLDLFFGRTLEVRSLIEHLNTPGQHALLFGDRGVGKSSLANIASDLLLKRLASGKFFKKRCDSTDSFRSVFAEPLAHVGVNLQVVGSESRKAEGGKADIGIPGLGGGVHTTSETTLKERGLSSELDSPGWVAAKLSGLDGLLLVDELDALRDPSDRHKIAELIKQLSDEGSLFKILLVGIAETGVDLTDGHQSVERCLRETRLGRMSDIELKQIVDKGEKALNLKFTAQAKTRIVTVSSGYPHFTHLLALKAAEDAIAEGRTEIGVAGIEAATRRAVDDSEGRLKRQYDEACRSYGTDEYRRIVCAAALLGSEEFNAAALREKYLKLWGRKIDQNSLNNYFNRLVSDSGGTILRRLAKGVYRFNDPRMPSYVRIANMHSINMEQ
ncbi:ATP-binding protein [Thioalkalicoccus limnaeus]|uniref:ATP-binding protein n=1 Tax=Thioalkalicoccus limnaeus TaxID=120681 RepID=A0ABV4BLB1_9GAMM